MNEISVAHRRIKIKPWIKIYFGFGRCYLPSASHFTNRGRADSRISGPEWSCQCSGTTTLAAAGAPACDAGWRPVLCAILLDILGDFLTAKSGFFLL
jgi:hypothetical protein